MSFFWFPIPVSPRQAPIQAKQTGGAAVVVVAEAVADAVAVAGAADVDNAIDRSVIRSLTWQRLKCLKP